MKIKELLALRDVAIRDALREVVDGLGLPEEVAMRVKGSLRDAFEHGAERWEQEHMPDICGKEGVEQVEKAIGFDLC